jgi:hypothetical protein
VLRAFSFIIVVSMRCAAFAETATEKEGTVPLGEIWAYNSIGTRDIRELNKENIKATGKDLLDPLGVSCMERGEALKWRDVARPAFAVQGSGLSALRAACDALINNKRPANAFRTGVNISVVFFAEPVAPQLEILRVSRKGPRIELQYRWDKISERAFNFALIPLGRLPLGQYYFETQQMPDLKLSEEKRARQAECSQNYLCQPFAFTVNEKGM